MSSIRSEPIPTSDTESVDEALLSPSDGFINQTTIPEEMHVPDPEQRNTQADKEREAREEQFLHASGSRHPDPTQAPLRSPDHRQTTSHVPSRSLDSAFDDHDADEHTPLISAAPPAYADVARDTNTNLEAATGYHTMGRETVSFFPSGAPQDLGGAQQPLLEHPSSRKRPSWRTCLTDGNKLGKLLVIICCALLVLGFLGKVLSYVSRHHGMPNMPDDAHARPRPVNCPGTIYRSKDERNFSTIQNLSLVQRKTQNKGRWSVHITGQVLVEKTDKNNKLNVNVEYRTNVESLLQEIALRPDEQDSGDDGALELWVPESSNERTVPWNSPCLDIDVVVSVPSGSSFESFYLSLKTLDIVFGDLSYVASSTSLETQTGSVRFASTSHVSSRVIRIHVGTGSVKGTYPLLDLLDVQTQTGSIDVTATPQEADEQRLPAKMRISSNTGSIRVAATLEDLPERDYQTTIQGGTSSIHVGPLMHGSHTGLHARTASIQGTLTPVGSLDEISAIEATSTTGSVTMNVAPHRKHPKKAMRHLNGMYSSHTGRVELTHPLQWEGTVRADSQTGSVRINWPGLSGSGDHGGGLLGIKLPGSSFEGNKGKGDALVVAHSGTGSVELNGRDIS